MRRTGRAERTEDPMPHTMSDVLVVLKPDRARSTEELERRRCANGLTKVPGVSALFTTPLGMRIDEGLGGTPADLSVRIFGPDLDQLAQLGERARAIMRSVDGIADLRAEKLTGLPQLRIAVDRAAAARVGLTPGDVIRAVRIGLAGEEVSEVWIGQRRFDLVVRLQDESRNDANAIRAPADRRPRRHAASRSASWREIEQTFGPGAIQREAGSRRIAVEASVAGRDLGSAAAEIRARSPSNCRSPPATSSTSAARSRARSARTRALAVAIGVALLAVFLLLYLALGSTADAA